MLKFVTRIRVAGYRPTCAGRRARLRLSRAWGTSTSSGSPEQSRTSTSVPQPSRVPGSRLWERSLPVWLCGHRRLAVSPAPRIPPQRSPSPARLPRTVSGFDFSRRVLPLSCLLGGPERSGQDRSRSPRTARAIASPTRRRPVRGATRVRTADASAEGPVQLPTEPAPPGSSQ